MATGLREPSTIAHRDIAMSGGISTRGFWTKRKRTSTSLIAVIGLIAGIAVAFKLFDQEVPNNIVRDASTFDYTLQARDLAAGETVLRSVTGLGDNVIFRQSKANPACAGQQPPAATTEACNVDNYPGDTRQTDVFITNSNIVPKKDASFEVYVEQSSIEVYSYDQATDTYALVPTGDADWQTFVNFWTLGVDKQTYFMSPQGEYENDPADDASYGTACTPTTLQGMDETNACKLGIIRKDGAMGAAFPGNPEPGTTIGMWTKRDIDDRQYRFLMTEEDNGADQSAYLGWRIDFSLVFQARLSPEAEAARYKPLPI